MKPRTALGRNPVTSPPDYSAAEFEFMTAMDRFKREFKRPYPTCSETLAVLLTLGYRRVAEPIDLPKFQPRSKSSHP